MWATWGVSELKPSQYDDDLYLGRTVSGDIFSYFYNLFTNPVVNLWHPLTVFSHDIFCYFFGKNHSIHHIVNIFLHLISAGLLAKWFFSFGWDKVFCICLATLWAVHPLAIEPTAWISGRKEILLALFSFLALVANQHPKLTKLLYVAVLGALLSKPTAIVLPLILFLDNWVKSPEPRDSVKEISLKFIALIPASAFVFVITLYFQSLGSQNFDDRSILTRFNEAGWAITKHLEHIFCPLDLHVGYLTPTSPNSLFVFVGLICLAIAIGFLFKKNLNPSLRIGLLLFLLFLLPTIGLVKAGNDLVTDRYAYLPLVGILLFIGGLSKNHNKWKVTYLLLPIIITFTFFSIQQRAHWKSSKTIFTRTLEVEPNHSYALAQLGTIAVKEDKLEEAYSLLQKSLRLEPLQPLAHNTLGNLAEKNRKFKKAKHHYKLLSKTWKSEPWVFIRLAILCWNLNELERAKSYLLIAKKLARNLEEKKTINQLWGKMKL